jgi:hypothetical protein
MSPISGGGGGGTGSGASDQEKVKEPQEDIFVRLSNKTADLSMGGM